jgi:hypothetical protein
MSSTDKTAGKGLRDATCSYSCDQGKSGKKRSPETCRKISETKALRAAERRALRPACLCYCGCGKHLPERCGKHTIYLCGHQPHPVTPATREKMSIGGKTRYANGYVQDEETKRKRVEATKQTRQKRKAAGKVYTTKGSAGRLRGYKWSKDVVEKRAAPLRGRAQTKPLSAKGPEHHKSVRGLLRSAENKTYRFDNMSEFVRTHEHLFDPDDVRWNERRHCRALKGLLALVAKGNHTRGSWKGWTLVSFTESFYNRGESLLTLEGSAAWNKEARR